MGGQTDIQDNFFLETIVAEFSKYKGCVNKKLENASEVTRYIPNEILKIGEKLNNLVSQFRNCIADVCNVMVSNSFINNFIICNKLKNFYYLEIR